MPRKAVSIVEPYKPLAQNKHTNQLIRAITEGMAPEHINLEGNGKRLFADDFELTIEGYTRLAREPNVLTAIFLDCLMLKATQQGLNDTAVRLSLSEYMALRGMTDEKTAREQVATAIKILKGIEFRFVGGVKKKDWINVSLYGGYSAIKNSIIHFRFNEEFFDSYKMTAKSLYMQYPTAVLQLNAKQTPWGYWIGRKLTEHKRINAGNPNEDIISIRALLDSCPDYPTYEAVREKSRHVHKLIIEPFERDITALKNTLTWEYIEGSGKTYADFIDAKIKITWLNYPVEVMQSLTENKQKAKKAREKTSKRGLSNEK
jgi:hypothetical protein